MMDTLDHIETADAISIEQDLAKLSLALDAAHRRYRAWALGGSLNSLLDVEAHTVAALARLSPCSSHARIGDMTAKLVRYAQATDAQLQQCMLSRTIDVTHRAAH